MSVTELREVSVVKRYRISSIFAAKVLTRGLTPIMAHLKRLNTSRNGTRPEKNENYEQFHLTKPLTG